MSIPPLKIRGHHLLCMLTYVGKGYTPAFIANFDHVIANLNKGNASVLIVDGPDVLCEALQGEAACEHAAHCETQRVQERDRLALDAVSKVFGVRETLKAGYSWPISSETVGLLRQHFRTGAVRAACGGCEWHELCSGIADHEYADAKLFPVKPN